jgi:hypothetical protein
VRHARQVLLKAERFQDETAILRQNGALTPLEYFDGHAAMFQPPSISLGGRVTNLGSTEMSELADAIKDQPIIGRLRPFQTPYGLSLLRENYPEDMVDYHPAVATALSEIVGLTELFSMIPITDQLAWFQAYQAAMSARKPSTKLSRESRAHELGVAVSRHALPDIEFKTYNDVLDAKDACRDEQQFWEHMRSEAREIRNASDESGAQAIQRAANNVTNSLNDLERKLSDLSKRRIKGVVGIATAAGVGTAIQAVQIPVVPWLTTLLSSLTSAALAAREAARTSRKPTPDEFLSKNGLSYLLKVRRRLSPGGSP